MERISTSPPGRIAIIGAGIAGATCARLLADAGHPVRVFDKSRGVGGRMATRRADWVDAAGATSQARFDHGAPAFEARSAAFLRFIERAWRDGLVAPWRPAVAPGSRAPLVDAPLWVSMPDMPSLCRALLADVPVHTGAAIDALRRTPGGWRLESGGAVVMDGATHVIVATPPQQAAALLRPSLPDWARRAQALPMAPGWTLMGVTDEPEPAFPWGLARPTAGPIGLVVRNDTKPGRVRTPGLAHWVVHATPAWSLMFVELQPADAQARLQDAMAQWLGRTPRWHHATAHRWRYASALGEAAEPCWWDPASGLGVCGDALGSTGVEGAWASARALAAAIAGVPADALDRPPVETR